jgi:hypothetical protein
MRPIPKKLREEMSQDPYYSRCCLNDHECEGRVTWHHTIIIRNRQISEKWAIVPACQYHHDHTNKEYLERLELVALNRASVTDLQAISKAIDWVQRRSYLRSKYREEI